jgi:3-deoxy-D-manno-octulosonic-acid transferase
MLSSLYQYAFIAYVGGGFGKGIHNTLEAAVYGKPVLFGPAFHKFQEAADLVGCGGAFVVAGEKECIGIINTMRDDQDVYVKACECCRDYVRAKQGATQSILNYIQENRLLTR